MEKNKVLRPGMYIRTRDGYIRYIIDIIFPRDKNPEWFLLLDGKPFDTRDLAEIGKNIAKYSFNLIDLIEEGDYVNGQLVYYDEELECLGQNFIDADGNYYFESITKGGDYKIKTILTKEQYENNVYKVEDK